MLAVVVIASCLAKMWNCCVMRAAAADATVSYMRERDKLYRDLESGFAMQHGRYSISSERAERLPAAVPFTLLTSCAKTAENHRFGRTRA